MSSQSSGIQERVGDRLPTNRITKNWLRPAIIIGVVIGSYYFGRQASMGTIMLIMGVIGALVFMRWPMIGLLLLPVASLLVDYELGTGTQSSINPPMVLVGLLLVLWLADMLVRQRRVWIYPSRVMLPVFAFIIVAILSFLVGQLPWFAFAQQVSLTAQLGGLLIFILLAGTFIWITQHVTDVKWLRWTVWIFLAISTVAMVGFMIIPGQIGRVVVPQATGSAFWLWTVALSAGQALFNKKLAMRWRIAFILLIIVVLINSWTNRGWASGWAPAIVTLAVIIFFINWRLGLFASLLMGLIFLYFDPAGTVQSFLTADQYSLFTRQEAWAIVLGNIVKVNPVLGLGPANYYNYTPLFPILGYAVRFNSHNQYVDLIAQTGVLGLSMYLWLMFEVGWLAWRLMHRALAGFEKAYVIGALGGLAGTLVAGMLGDWIIPFVYNIGMKGFRASIFAWLFLGGLVVIERQINQRAIAQSGESASGVTDEKG